MAAGIWVVDPAFMLDLVHEQLNGDVTTPAREEAYFAGARINDDELRDSARGDERPRAQTRARHAEAEIRGVLMQPTEAQLDALRQILCRLLVRHYGELIAYGAGWTDPERQRPVGDTGRHERRHVEASSTARSPTPTRCEASPSSLLDWERPSCSTPPP